jgi:hypothetical protein
LPPIGEVNSPPHPKATSEVNSPLLSTYGIHLLRVCKYKP